VGSGADLMRNYEARCEEGKTERTGSRFMKTPYVVNHTDLDD